MIKTGSTALAADFVITLIAGEALTALDAVYINTADGKAYKCDADDTAKLGFIGFAQEGALLGANVQIRNHGLMTGFVGLTVGSTYYLSGTLGAITTTAPTYKRPVGIAVSATVIKIIPYSDFYNCSFFSGSGSFTVPGGINKIRVICIGGGGGSGDASPTGSAVGGNGGNTSFGALMTANGGTGSNYYADPTGGAGGTGGSGGQINRNGHKGGDGANYGSGNPSRGGRGGTSGNGWPSGGEGENAGTNETSTGGGGGGEYREGIFAVTEGDVYTVTIGAAGTTRGVDGPQPQAGACVVYW